METAKRSGVARVQGRGSDVNRWSTGHLGAVNYSVGYCHCGYVTLCVCQNSQNCARPKVNLNISYGLQLIIMCCDCIISHNVCVTSVNDGKLCVCGVGGKRHVGARYFLCYFSVSLKVL